MSENEPPSGMKKGGLRLWRSIMDEYDLSETELQLLELACRARDRIDQLEKVLLHDGIGAGTKIHPALVESRQQQQLLARLVVALRMPDDEDERPQRRSMRGLYVGKRRRMIEERRAQLRVMHQR